MLIFILGVAIGTPGGFAVRALCSAAKSDDPVPQPHGKKIGENSTPNE